MKELIWLINIALIILVLEYFIKISIDIMIWSKKKKGKQSVSLKTITNRKIDVIKLSFAFVFFVIMEADKLLSLIHPDLNIHDQTLFRYGVEFFLLAYIVEARNNHKLIINNNGLYQGLKYTKWNEVHSCKIDQNKKIVEISTGNKIVNGMISSEQIDGLEKLLHAHQKRILKISD